MSKLFGVSFPAGWRCGLTENDLSRIESFETDSEMVSCSSLLVVRWVVVSGIFPSIIVKPRE